MKLSQHFTLEEMTISQEAARRGIDNAPSPQIIAALRYTCQRLESVRSFLAVPMIISSGYRCAALNAALGGVPTSAHLQGWAADFIAPGFGPPLDVCMKIAGVHGMQFDQVIQEGTWTHISFAPAMRRMCLTAQFASDGKASYSDGLNGARGTV